VPALPETLHAMHRLVQALLQQNPSTQRPFAQSLPDVHAVPDGQPEQLPPPPQSMPTSLPFLTPSEHD
jgi:hypothetical protein